MAKEIKTIKKMNREEIAKLLLNYVNKSNLVNQVVARNRGGARESTFNESEVGSAANYTIHKVVTKIEEYREALKLNPDAVKKQFEDIPLVVKYFDQSFDNLLKDLANQAGAQKRARFTEILHTFTNDEINADEIHGSWEEVQSRERCDILTECESKLTMALSNSSEDVKNLMLKIFNLQFVSHITSDEEIARELKIQSEVVSKMTSQLSGLLAKHCKTELGELLKLIRDNASHWDTGRDEAKAANRISARSKRMAEENNIIPSDTSCEISTVTHYKVEKAAKSTETQVRVSITVQIVRDTSGVKETVEVVGHFDSVTPGMKEAQSYRSSIQSEVKKLEAHARQLCENRRRIASQIFNGEAA